MKTQADSADLCPPHPHHPQTSFSSLSIKPVLLCLLLNFLLHYKASWISWKDVGYTVERLAGRNKKQEKTTTKRKNKGETQQGFGEACIVLDYTHLQNEDREEFEKTANFGWKSLLFSFCEESAMNDWQATSCSKKRCSYFMYNMNVFQPHGLPLSRCRRLNFHQML